MGVFHDRAAGRVNPDELEDEEWIAELGDGLAGANDVVAATLRIHERRRRVSGSKPGLRPTTHSLGAPPSIPHGRIAPGRSVTTTALGGAAVARFAEGQARPDAVEAVARARARGGEVLEPVLRARLARSLGTDLDDVRVHRDGDADRAAAALGARAFAIGKDVFFRAGMYDPESPGGQRLIAHEVAHTVQTPRAAPVGQGLVVSEPGDTCEREADAFADHFVRTMHGVTPRVAASDQARGASSAQAVFGGPKPAVSPSVGEAPASGLADDFVHRLHGARPPEPPADVPVPRSRPGAGISLILRDPAPQGQSGSASASSQSSGGGLLGALDTVAQALDLKRQVEALRGRAQDLQAKVQLLSKIHFKGDTLPRASQAVALYNAAVAALPQGITGFRTLPAFGSPEFQAAIAGFAVPAPVLIPLLEALAEALAALLALLGEVLLIVLVVLLALIALFLLIKTIVEAIEDAIERLRPQPPIFWSASLPLPPAVTFVRTKPANPRVPGGQQSVVAAAIRAQGMSAVLVAHHVIPLFLGGRDELTAPPNVVPWPTPMHIIGHASLVVQPQMAIWGYPINLYSHPPPGGYFLAGVKAP